MHRTGQATYIMFSTSLQETMQRYFDAKDIKTFEALAAEATLKEQFLSSLQDNVRQFGFQNDQQTRLSVRNLPICTLK